MHTHKHIYTYHPHTPTHPHTHTPPNKFDKNTLLRPDKATGSNLNQHDDGKDRFSSVNANEHLPSAEKVQEPNYLNVRFT